MKKIFFFFIFFIFAYNSAFSIEIRGKVKGSENEPMPGVSIFLEGTSKGAITNGEGEYVIKNAPSGTFAITSFLLGYKKEKKVINLANEKEYVVNFTINQVSATLSEINVTADKREENLQTVPISVSAITEDRLEEQKITRRSDLSALAPNTLVAETGSSITNTVNIRGMFPSKVNATSTLFFLDGIPIFDNSMSPNIFDDVERIEVLRGPQGTLYGANTFSGVINIVSKKPTNITKTNLNIGYGNYNNTNVNFGISSPIVQDVLFTRVSGFYQKTDGYYTNTFDGSNVGGNKYYGGNINLRYFPAESFSAELFTNVTQVDENINPAGISPDSIIKNPFKISRDYNSTLKEMLILSSLKLTYKTPYANIVSTTAYQRRGNFNWQYDADFTANDLIKYNEYWDSYDVSEELRLESYDVTSPLKWTAGIYYSTGDGTGNYGYDLSAIYTKLAPIRQTTIGKGGNNHGAAIFGQASYTIDNFELTAGLRYEESKGENNNELQTIFMGPDNPIYKHGQILQDTTLALTQADHALSPKFALSYRLNEDMMVYASYVRGYHAGGFNSGGDLNLLTFKPENTNNFELGYKGTLLDNRLRLNADIFYIDWNDQQFQEIGTPATPLNTIVNAEHTTVNGLEIEANAIIMKGLSLDWSLGYLNAKFDKYTPNKNIDNGYNYLDKRLPFSPNFSSCVRLRYEYPVNLLQNGENLFVSLDHQYLGSYYMSAMNLFASTPRNLINGEVGLTGKYVDVIFWGKNLLDYHYVFAVFEYRHGNQSFLGAPRTMGLSVNLKY